MSSYPDASGDRRQSLGNPSISYPARAIPFAISQYPTQCALALESDYFGRQFGAAISIGLLFLLEASEQVALLRRVSEILLPGGRFLFTAPIETGTWRDTTTGHECRSLGRARYVEALENAGFCVIGTHVDEGRNNHYEAQKVRIGGVHIERCR